MQNKETEDYYRSRAPEYEQIYYRENAPRREEIDDEAVRLRILAAGKRVLEFACGTGYWTSILAETADQITAIDASPEMLDEARKKSYRAPVDFVESDMFDYVPLPGSIDLAVAGFWFSHQPRESWERFFDLLTVPLKAEGRIWLIDNNPPAEGPDSHHVRFDEYGNNYKYRFLDDGRRFVILKNYFTEKELREAFDKRFEISRLIYGTFYWAAELRPR